MNMNEKRRMNKEESKKTVKLMGIMGIINIISCLILKWCPIYGLNALIMALPNCFVLYHFLDDKPRQGMLLAVVLISSCFALPLSLRMGCIGILAAVVSELFYGFSKDKKSDQRNKVSLITTFNTLIYPGLLLWELLATQGESTIMMIDFTSALLIFTFSHILGFVGVKLCLKDKAEYDY